MVADHQGGGHQGRVIFVAANQARRKARLHNALEHPPENASACPQLGRAYRRLGVVRQPADCHPGSHMPSMAPSATANALISTTMPAVARISLRRERALVSGSISTSRSLL